MKSFLEQTGLFEQVISISHFAPHPVFVKQDNNTVCPVEIILTAPTEIKLRKKIIEARNRLTASKVYLVVRPITRRKESCSIRATFLGSDCFLTLKEEGN
jgi:hypothetical protein